MYLSIPVLLVYASVMATIKEMRKQLSTAGQQGYTDKIRNMTGITGAPKDATEVFILYLALESVRGKPYANDALRWVGLWYYENYGAVQGRPLE